MWSVWNAQAYTMYHVLTRWDPYEMHIQCNVLTSWDPYEMHIQCTMY